MTRSLWSDGIAPTKKAVNRTRCFQFLRHKYVAGIYCAPNTVYTVVKSSLISFPTKDYPEGYKACDSHDAFTMVIRNCSY